MLEQSVAKTAVRERLVRVQAAPALIAVTVFAVCGGRHRRVASTERGQRADAGARQVGG
jgi:hypothetical protein